MQGIYEPNELLLACAENFQVVFNNATQLEWLDKCILPVPLKAWVLAD